MGDEYEQIDVVTLPLDEARHDYRSAARRYFTDVTSALALGLALDRLERPGA